MKTITAVSAIALVAGIAGAGTTDFFATISSGPQQVNPSGSPAVGNLTGTYDSDANSFSFSWDISDMLIGTPSSPGSHLHMAPSGVGGPIVFAFNEPDGTWALSGSAVWEGLSMMEVDALFAGNIYANFHTDTFPGGEVRGQIVPAPAGFGILSIAGLATLRRRTR